MRIESRVGVQPKSMDETVLGAILRAKDAFHFSTCDYSIGIESGLMAVPYTQSGYMDFSACVIYDGKRNHIGFSRALEFPTEVIRRIFEEGIEVDEAVKRCALTNKQRLGYEEGLIGLLTKGKITRKKYTEDAIMMALVQFENPELYRM